ncbi:hypothetical protein [Endozoicomonas numazuensis]|uniref:Uncharacterized protein n=1 Tax=Endozoicomonas numazuensis TaxID=1137799 RepID=A0A081NJS4_9GAMM|nr:hypothetical protein [Endozoicomonas numazuensis]KEQ18697.1 hypothetical protein GZ78_00840 [Endozoicomonas numazuensis]
MEESNSIKRLKSKLIKELPFFPNDRETLGELESQNINDVVIHYLHWQTRQVPIRVRKIQRAPEVTSDSRYKNLKDGINALLDKARGGEDLHPYLSKRAHKNGYTPVERIKNGEVDAWDDKDQILNTKGFHHFHLNMEIEKSGLSKRTNEVLFAFVSRDTFHAIGIFDHSVFDFSTENGQMTQERERMWCIHEKYTTLGMEPGTVYMSNPIMTSGHPLYLIRMADHYTQIILNNDAKLNERNFVNSLYDAGNKPHPKKFNLDWHIEGLDLGLIDKKNDIFFSLQQGHL